MGFDVSGIQGVPQGIHWFRPAAGCHHHSPLVLCFMTPLPSSAGSSKHGASPKTASQNKPQQPSKPVAKDHQLKANPQKREDVLSVKELLAALPTSCVSKTENGKFICLRYNNGTCKRQKQSSCNMGLHICYFKGCGKKRPYIECSH